MSAAAVALPRCCGDIHPVAASAGCCCLEGKSALCWLPSVCCCCCCGSGGGCCGAWRGTASSERVELAPVLGAGESVRLGDGGRSESTDSWKGTASRAGSRPSTRPATSSCRNAALLRRDPMHPGSILPLRDHHIKHLTCGAGSHWCVDAFRHHHHEMPGFVETNASYASSGRLVIPFPASTSQVVLHMSHFGAFSGRTFSERTPASEDSGFG